MSNLHELLNAIKARADAATAGPWERESGIFGRLRVFRETDQGELLCVASLTDGISPKHDASFIAAARTDVPRLVAALRLAIEQRDEHYQVPALWWHERCKQQGHDDAEIAAILEGNDDH